MDFTASDHAQAASVTGTVERGRVSSGPVRRDENVSTVRQQRRILSVERIASVLRVLARAAAARRVRGPARSGVGECGGSSAADQVDDRKGNGGAGPTRWSAR